MGSEGEKRADEYRSGGIVPGVVGLGCVAGIVAVGVGDPNLDFPLWGFPLALVAIIVVWALMIRPCVRLEPTELHLRNVFHDRWIPYARIDAIEIAQVTRVRVGDDTFVGSGFGRSRRAMRSDARKDDDARDIDHSVGWIVEERIRRRMSDAWPADSGHADPGDRADSVRHQWAWPVIGGIGGTALLTVVLTLL